jgi:MFS family permease
VVLELSPLKKYPQYRWLFFGQLVSMLGSSITWVASPYYIYELTHSTAKVGLLGIVSLVPLVLCGIWGGAVADKMNRKVIIVLCETLLTLLCAGFAWMIQTKSASELSVFVFTALSACLAGFHRPALESLTPRLVAKEDLPKVSSLQGFRGTFAHIIGPAIGGLLIAAGGVAMTFWLDALSYLASVVCLLMITNPKRDASAEARPSVGWTSIKEGLSYAVKRPAIMGTYIIDILAMTFCFPMALFPALSEMSGGATKLGPLYSAISAGSLVASIFSGWTYRQRRHGKLVVMAACGWCVFVLAFAGTISFNYWLALGLLATAGFADMISVMFRFTIWNEVIPDSHRGRLAGLEMISYMTGPLLGNTILGYLASVTSPQWALASGALVSLFCIIVATLWLRPFWDYQAAERSAA